jgi:hypothetical protein
MTTVRAIFHDGEMYEAPGWRAMEDALMADAWNPSREEKFRAEMVLRAENWSGVTMNTEGSSRVFLRSMEAAGLMRLEVER